MVVKKLFVVFSIILLSAIQIQAEETEDPAVTFSAALTHDYLYNMSGGIKRGNANMGNIDLTLEADTEKAGLWKGGTFFVYYLGNYGNDATEIVGDAQTSSNIQAYSTSKLYEAWYNHSFADDKFALLVGLFDYNSEFDVLEYAGSLINSSFGISPDISQVSPSIFPTTSLAARVRYNIDENVYFQSAVFDGVPGSPYDPEGTQISFANGDGVFWGTEIGTVGNFDDKENYYKYAIGLWTNTAEYEDFQGLNRDDNSGIYFIAEKTIYSEEDSSQGLGAFFQSGTAKRDRNQFNRYFGAGLVYTGLINGRDEDVTALGVAYAGASGDFKDANPGTDSHETAVELSYIVLLNDNITLQPDLQYIVNPGLDSSLNDAFVFTLRSTLSY